MSAIGLILDGFAAMLIAYGQWRVSVVTSAWLNLIDANMATLREGSYTHADLHIRTDGDQQMNRAVRFSRWISMAGWTLFVLGIALQVWATAIK